MSENGKPETSENAESEPASQPSVPSEKSEPPKTVQVVFKTWVSGIVTFFTVVSCIAAALSAYFSSQGVEVAIAGVNAQARNEAFSRIVAATQSFCDLSLGEVSARTEGFTAHDRLIVRVDNDTLRTNVTDDELRRIEREVFEKSRELDKAVQNAFVWLDSGKVEAIEYHTPSLIRGVYEYKAMKEWKFPPQISLIENDYKCLGWSNNVIDVYLGRPVREANSGVIVVPHDDDNAVRIDLMLKWGMDEEVRLIRASGYAGASGYPERLTNPSGSVGDQPN